MIKKIVFYSFIILLLIIFLFALMQINKNNPLYIIKSLELQNKLLSEEKILVFRTSYLGFLSLGDAELENKGIDVYKDKKVYHLSASASVTKFISNFFNAQAHADSYIDKDKLHSLRFIQTLILPDKPKEEKEVLYDQENNFMELRGVKRQILPDTQDPLSAMFFIQHQVLELGKEFDININTNQKNYRLYAKVIKKEEYTLEDKKMCVWVLNGEIRRRDKSPRHRTRITLWLLDNPLKTPILIKTITNIGPITARLIKLRKPY